MQNLGQIQERSFRYYWQYFCSAPFSDNQAVIRPTTRRTHGATIATVGKAIGHVVAQLFSHCPGNPEVIPCVVARTNAETIATMMTESSALNRMGANRAGIRMFILLCKV
jgi:hypothetical protein